MRHQGAHQQYFVTAALSVQLRSTQRDSNERHGMDFVWFILIGIAAGWLAGQFTKGSSFGLLGNLIVGVIGALVGGLLFGLLGLEATGLVGSLVVATVGAIVALAVLRKFAN
jgi:uncharacterized membrane protein YeaQ/YmgE (transglycosylase-associated protein family)